MQAEQANDNIFQVYDKNNKKWVADMKEMTCLCHQFEHDKLPCAHALTASGKMHMGVYKYCSEYYTKEALEKTYAATVYPLGDPSTWEVPKDIKNMKILSRFTKIPRG